MSRAASFALVALLGLVASPLVLAALGGTDAPVVSAAPWGAWVTQTVDTTPPVPFFSGIAVNSHDLPVISWPTQQGVHIETTTNGLTWTTSFDDPNTIQDSVAVDASDHVHACMKYDDQVNPEHLAYVTNKTGAWVETAVDTTGRTGFFCNIAVDKQGYPHIVYDGVATASSGHLLYAFEDATGWHVETVATVLEMGVQHSLALDPLGVPHIASDDFATDPSYGSVRYYSRTSPGVWTSETAVAHGSFSSLAIGASGIPQVAYYAQGFVLAYASKSAGAWTSVVVDSASVTGQYPKIALDSHERPHIAYKQGAGAPITDHPRYATRDSTGKWETEYVYLDSVDSLSPNIAIDHEDRPHVVFMEARDQTGVNGDVGLMYSMPVSALSDTHPISNQHARIAAQVRCPRVLAGGWKTHSIAHRLRH